MPAFSAQKSKSLVLKQKVNAFLTGNGLSVLALPCFALFLCVLFILNLSHRSDMPACNHWESQRRSGKQLNRLPDLTIISTLLSSREPLLKVRLIFIFYAGRRQVESPFDIPSLFSYIVVAILFS